MAERPKATQQSQDRQQRLAAALRENLGKRKAQARARAAAGKPQSRGNADKPDKS